MCVNENMKKRFSIIVPVYNAEKYLHQCIRSILDQSFENFEVIFINDGSRDRSPEILDQYADQDRRIKVLHQENKGQNAARKKGLADSSGEFVMFLDSDDWIESETLQRCNEIIEENQSDLIVFGNKRKHGENIISEPVFLSAGFYTREKIEQEIFPVLMMDKYGRFFPRALWGKVYKKENLCKHLNAVPDMIRNGEDMCCIISLVMECQSMTILQDCLYCYRTDDSHSVSRSGDGLALIRCKKIADFLKETSDQNCWEEIEQLYRLLVQQIYSSCLRTLDAVGIGDTFKKDFNNVMKQSICKDAVANAFFAKSARKLRIKQLILRYRLFSLMLWMRKIG